MNAYAGCGRPTLNVIECFDLGRSFLDSEAGFILFAVIRGEKSWAFKDVRESFKGTFEQEAEVTNSRTHFKEYPEVCQNS